MSRPVAKKEAASKPKSQPEPVKLAESKPVAPVETIVELGPEETIKNSILPLFLTTATLKLFDIRIGDNVSKENPLIMIQKKQLMEDIQTRLAISDFQPAKQQILDYPADTLALFYDHEFNHGQNFYLISTLAGKEALDQQSRVTVEQVQEGKQPRKWSSLGSEAEIDCQTAKPLRPKISSFMTRRRKDFGQELKLNDSEVTLFSIESYELEVPDVQRLETSVGVQSVEKGADNFTQTSWFRAKGTSTQYEAQELREEEVQEVLESEATAVVLQKLVDNLESVLYYNEFVDIFFDDYEKLGDDDLMIEDNSSAGLLEFQSFTDTIHSKDTTIAALDWYPLQRGVIAHSCVKRQTIDERIEAGFPIYPKSSMVLIWSFQDPIHPLAPDDINCLQFNPKNPHLIAGGCINGQIIIWDIHEYTKILQADKKTAAESNAITKKSLEAPVVKWTIATPIELSHKGPITDLTWIETPIEHSSMGYHDIDADGTYTQLITCSLDGFVAFWDTRHKTVKDLRSNSKDGDALGKAFMKIVINTADNSLEYSLTKLSIRNATTPVSVDEKNPQKQHQAIPKNFSKFFCGSEEGHLLYADWSVEKDKGEDKATHVEYSSNIHFACVSDIKRSPFFNDIVLSIGGWSFTIWREENKKISSLLRYTCQGVSLISACWSPTRPGVFFVTRSDGKLESWDILDNYYEPICIQSISSSGLASLSPIHYSGKSHSKNQYLAAGDDDGTLHILEVPRTLSKPPKAEKSILQTFFDMESKRLAYVSERKSKQENLGESLTTGSSSQSLVNSSLVGSLGSASAAFEENFMKLEQDLNESLAF